MFMLIFIIYNNVNVNVNITKYNLSIVCLSLLM